MNEPTRRILEQIAHELTLDEEFLEKITQDLAEGDLGIVRVRLLGIIDARVDNKDISDERAAQYYEWLGFSAEEKRRFRQYRAMSEYSEKKRPN